MVDIALFAKASELHQQGRFAEAHALYEQVLAAYPGHALSRLHLAIMAHQQGDTESAIEHVDLALAADPGLVEAHRCRGIFMVTLQQFNEALASFDHAIALAPNDAALHRSRGSLLETMGRPAEAIQSLAQALDLDPDTPLALGDCIHLAQSLCDWRDWHDLIGVLLARVEAGQPACSPMVLHLLPATLEQQRRASATYFNFLTGPLPQSKFSPTNRGEKIRVGYFSADFCNHAVALAIAELFEKHDRSQFELFAFMLARKKPDAMQERLRKAFDHFIDVSAESDLQAVEIARQMKLDIAVDLMGHTAFSRPGIFALRAAAVQVSYLGYPGTMGTKAIDYIFADRIVIPPEHRRHFDEQICYLPHSYQANDSQRVIADKTFTRAELNLPEQGVVFCCFNVNHKITPDVYDSWMRILARVPGSVLWLYSRNQLARDNLREETRKRGIDPKRVVFAPFMHLPEHLARHRSADLFLDTFHYGGHGTAGHALWAGLPVLTRLGSTFPGRVAASLLTALDLPELITTTTADYEDMAVSLTANPTRLAALKQRLWENRKTSPLFDTPRFARNVEAAYRAMLDRHEAGLPPEDLYISDAADTADVPSASHAKMP